MIFEAPKRHVNRVFLHCSASDLPAQGQDLVELIRGWHLARQFNDVGYHYIIDQLGETLAGRPLEKTPAAQRGHNLRTIAVCCHGLEFRDTWPHSAQAAALINLCGQIHRAYRGVVAFWPHNAVANKACPVFDEKELLGLDRWRRMS